MNRGFPSCLAQFPIIDHVQLLTARSLKILHPAAVISAQLRLEDSGPRHSISRKLESSDYA